MLEFLLGPRRDRARADRIINYLNNAFEVSEWNRGSERHKALIPLDWASVKVEITCHNGKIYVRLEGFSSSDYFNYHVPGQIERVKAEIYRLIAGSHAAKWRHRVIITGVVIT